MELSEITNGFRERVGEDCGLGSTVKLDFGDDGVIFLDASQVPNIVSNDDNDAQCTMSISKDDFLSMVSGDLDGMTAFMMGKLKISGDMGVAMQLRGLLGG